jgi:hypothetical protein
VVVEISAKGLSTYSLGVLHERARLAIEDPAGEAEAVAPLDYEQAWYLFLWCEAHVGHRSFPVPDGELGERLGLPQGRSSGMLPCPAHDDRNKSLSWKRKPDGFVLVRCFAGCTYGEIARAVGL